RPRNERFFLVRRLKRSPWKASVFPQRCSSTHLQKDGNVKDKVTLQFIDLVSKTTFWTSNHKCLRWGEHLRIVPVRIFKKRAFVHWQLHSSMQHQCLEINANS